MALQAQVTIFQNPETGKVTLEIPQNGGRRSIILNENNPSTWGEIIKAELDAANAWARKIHLREIEAERQKQEYLYSVREKIYWERHHQIHDTISERKGQGPEFAEKKLGGRNKNSKKKVFIEDLLQMS